MYYVCRQINLNKPHAKELIDIIIVNDKPNWTYVCQVHDEEDKVYASPIDAANFALSLRSKIDKDSKIQIRISRLVTKDSAEPVFIFKTSLSYKLYTWADGEYSKLTKCKWCRQIMPDEMPSTGNGLFCSDTCNEKRQAYQNQIKEEEHEFFLD